MMATQLRFHMAWFVFGMCSGMLLILCSYHSRFYINLHSSLMDSTDDIQGESSTDQQYIDGTRATLNYDALQFHPQCGNGEWQRAYSRLHAQILAKARSEQRFLVYDSFKNGFGDMFTSAITTFYLALLSDRAITFDWKERPIDEALLTHMVNWNYTEAVHPLAEESVQSINHVQEDGDGTQAHEWFRDRDLGQVLDPDARVVEYQANQGQLWNLFENVHHKRRLYEMGLRPETAYGCAADMLFRIHPSVIEENRADWDRFHPNTTSEELARRPWTQPTLHNGVQSDATVELTVGIQLRLGDVYATGEEEGFAFVGAGTKMNSTLNCADELLNSFPKYVKPTLFVVSDNIQARQYMHNHYANVITDLKTSSVGHTGIQQKSAKIIRRSLSDMLLFGNTDYQVILRSSSFGRSGVVWSMQSNSMVSVPSSMYMVDTHNDQYTIRSCRFNSTETFRQYSVGAVHV